jgi:hydrogenase 3 maturation protease
MLADRGLEGVIDSGVAPELDTWHLRELGSDNILFVDAVDFGGKPGEVTLLASADLRKVGFDTHRAPLKLTMEYLERDLGCKCYVLAIQPRDVRQGAPMCSEVKRSAANLAEILVEACRAGVRDGRR